MSTRRSFLIGDESNQHVQVSLLRRNRPECNDFWDGNWISSTVDLQVGAYEAHFGVDFRAEEFESFHTSVCALYKSLRGSACFKTMEEQLLLELIGDGHGHIRVEGTSIDRLCSGNRLDFKFELDQTYLARLISGLEKCLSTYPVVGKR